MAVPLQPQPQPQPQQGGGDDDAGGDHHRRRQHHKFDENEDEDEEDGSYHQAAQAEREDEQEVLEREREPEPEWRRRRLAVLRRVTRPVIERCCEDGEGCCSGGVTHCITLVNRDTQWLASHADDDIDLSSSFLTVSLSSSSSSPSSSAASWDALPAAWARPPAFAAAVDALGCAVDEARASLPADLERARAGLQDYRERVAKAVRSPPKDSDDFGGVHEDHVRDAPAAASTDRRFRTFAPPPFLRPFLPREHDGPGGASSWETHDDNEELRNEDSLALARAFPWVFRKASHAPRTVPLASAAQGVERQEAQCTEKPPVHQADHHALMTADDDRTPPTQTLPLPLLGLPEAVLRVVAGFLHPRDLLALSWTCARARRAVVSYDSLWQWTHFADHARYMMAHSVVEWEARARELVAVLLQAPAVLDGLCREMDWRGTRVEALLDQTDGFLVDLPGPVERQSRIDAYAARFGELAALIAFCCQQSKLEMMRQPITEEVAEGAPLPPRREMARQAEYAVADAVQLRDDPSIVDGHRALAALFDHHTAASYVERLRAFVGRIAPFADAALSQAEAFGALIDTCDALKASARELRLQVSKLNMRNQDQKRILGVLLGENTRDVVDLASALHQRADPHNECPPAIRALIERLHVKPEVPVKRTLSEVMVDVIAPQRAIKHEHLDPPHYAPWFFIGHGGSADHLETVRAPLPFRQDHL